MTFTRAIVQKPGPNFHQAITAGGPGAPDFEKALAQHAAYCDALAQCGLELTVLEADPTDPDTFAEENIADVDAFVAASSDDESNILGAL